MTGCGTSRSSSRALTSGSTTEKLLTSRAIAMAARRVFLVFVIAACLKSNDITVRTSAIDNRSPSDTGDDYDFQHVATEGYAQQKPGFYAVHGQADWTSMFSESTKGTRPPLPASVDFTKQMLF